MSEAGYIIGMSYKPLKPDTGLKVNNEYKAEHIISPKEKIQYQF